jgi:hypothetical protein
MISRTSPTNTTNPPMRFVVASECFDLATDIEVGFLYAHGHGQPPVKGGKNATSRAPAIGASNGTVR